MGDAIKGASATDLLQTPCASRDRPPPVVRHSVSEGVADHIRKLIFSGDLGDGSRVPQREIAEALGVSSVPVREALAALQREGAVTIEPNRGAFVNGLDADVVVEQFYIFGRIYGRAVRVTAERVDREVARSLVNLAARIQAEPDLDAMMHLSIQFQLTIVDHGGSKRLRALFTSLSRIVPGNLFVTVAGTADVARYGVVPIASAIEAGKPGAAERACWQLVDEIGERIADRFRGHAPT